MEETSVSPWKKFVKVITNKYTIVTVIFAVIVLFVDRNNLIRWAGDYPGHTDA